MPAGDPGQVRGTYGDTEAQTMKRIGGVQQELEP